MTWLTAAGASIKKTFFFFDLSDVMRPGWLLARGTKKNISQDEQLSIFTQVAFFKPFGSGEVERCLLQNPAFLRASAKVKSSTAPCCRDRRKANQREKQRQPFENAANP